MSNSWIRRTGTCFGVVLLTALLSCGGDGDDGGGDDALVTHSPVPYGVWRIREQVFVCETDSLVYSDQDEGLHGALLCEDAWRRFHDPSAHPMTRIAPGVYHYTFADTVQNRGCQLILHCDAIMEVDTAHRFVEETTITVATEDPAGCAGDIHCVRDRVIYTWWREATDQECAGAKAADALPRGRSWPPF